MSDENDLALQDLDAVTKALDDNMGSGGSSNPGQTKELIAAEDPAALAVGRMIFSLLGIRPPRFRARKAK